MARRAADRIINSTHSVVEGVRLPAPPDRAYWAGVPSVNSLVVDSVDSTTVVVLAVVVEEVVEPGCVVGEKVVVSLVARVLTERVVTISTESVRKKRKAVSTYS